MPKKKTKGARDRQVSKPLLTAFDKEWPGFSGEPLKVRLALIRLISYQFQSYRAHADDPDYFFVSHTELEKDFGRGKFSEVNDRLKLITVTGTGRPSQGVTKAYQLNGAAKNLRNKAYKKKTRGRLATTLDANGKVIRTLPKPLSSRDTAGNNPKFWNLEQIPQIVPVNTLRLYELRTTLERGDLFLTNDPLKKQRRLDALGGILRAAKHAIPGDGLIAHRYLESTTGRLTAYGENLQGTYRTIRKAALIGLWDYDFENCHYSILQQMAEQYGEKSPHIKAYLNDKAGTRQKLAAEVGVTVRQIKRALIAMIYGANATDSEKAALYDALNGDKAKVRTLLRNPVFKGLHGDIKLASRAILANCKTTQGRLINEAGKAINAGELPKRRMAHLIQGAEALILRAALRTHPKEIVLLIHDGFIAKERLDCRHIEAVIKQHTGYSMSLSCERIQMPADFDIDDD